MWVYANSAEASVWVFIDTSRSRARGLKRRGGDLCNAHFDENADQHTHVIRGVGNGCGVDFSC